MKIEKRILIIAAIAILMKLWVVSDMKLVAFEAGHDDLLYIQQAQSILEGKWLGTYEFKTLMKGPGYPIFIALNHIIGIPLLLSEQLLYVLSCIAIIIALRPLGMHPYARLIVFVILLFNPLTFTWRTMQSVTRGGLYVSISQLLIASIIWLYLRFQNLSLARIALWSSVTGVFATLFYLTREEWVWIVPFFFFLCLFFLIRIIKTGQLHAHFKKILVAGASFISIVCCLLFSVAFLNYKFYGVFRIHDMESAGYVRAYALMQSIRSANPNPLVPVARDVREALYRESPSFLELKPFFESPSGKERIELSCIYVHICNDIAGGWFGWGFRNAVSLAGYYTSARTADAYFDRLASEIESACGQKRLSCMPVSSISSWAYSRWDQKYIGEVARSFVESIKFLLEYQDFSTGTEFSVARASILKSFEEVTLNFITPRPASLELRGWVFSVAGSQVSVNILDNDHTRVAQALFFESPDVYKDYKKQFAPELAKTLLKSRFSVDVLCQSSSECAYLQLETGGTTILTIPLKHIIVGSPQFKNGFQFNIENLLDQDHSSSWLSSLKLSIRDQILHLYRLPAHPLFLIYSVTWLVSIAIRIRKRRLLEPLFEIHFAFFATLVGFLFLMSFINATSFPTRYPHYFTPCYGLLLIIYSLAIHDVFEKDHDSLH